jgi:hypothetical protein
MRCCLRIALTVQIFVVMAVAASKPHLIVFGKWTTVKWMSGAEENKPVDLRIRALFLDGRQKEFTFDATHEITDRLFVVRRALRVNDALPQESGGPARWSWQPAGWLLIDRATGHISQITLPDFDPAYSVATWYRDYVAYCGFSEDGKKIDAVVMQVGRRKPILKKSLGKTDGADPSADCDTPTWQRQPARVSFSAWDQNLTYAIRGRATETLPADIDEDESSE